MLTNAPSESAPFCIHIRSFAALVDLLYFFFNLADSPSSLLLNSRGSTVDGSEDPADEFRVPDVRGVHRRWRGHAGAGEGGEGILGGVSLVPDVCGERLVRWAVWSPKKIG